MVAVAGFDPAAAGLCSNTGPAAARTQSSITNGGCGWI
jgi:hypothetical protein